MTEHIQINDVAPRVQYVADGLQVAFTFPFAIFKLADLEVWQDDHVETGNYSVSGAGVSTGGVAIFATPPAAGTRITLRRRLSLARTSDYQADGLIRAKTLNDELDYQVAALQQVAEEVGRAVKRSPTAAAIAEVTLPEPAANRSLKWSADGSRLVNSANDPDAAGDATQAAAQAVAAAATTTLARDVVLAAVESVGDPLAKAVNLADLPNTAAARANLGLGSAALHDVGIAAGDVVALDAGGLIAATLLPPIETIPPGTIAAYAGAGAPANWLFCDGAMVSRSGYAALFAALGTRYGAGDGSTTFTLPDLRGRAAIGAGQGGGLSNRVVGSRIGAETHTLSVAEMPDHTHGYNMLGATQDISGYASASRNEDNYYATFPRVGPVSTGNTGGGSAHNNMPPSLVLNFIIKT